MNPQRSISSPGATQVAPRAQTQVGAFIGELTGAIDGLEKAIARHSEKLEPVLRVQDPTKGDVATPEEQLVPAADQIRTQVKRIIYLREAIESLTQRTEA